VGGGGRGLVQQCRKKWQTFQSAGADMQSESKAKEKVAADCSRNVDKTPKGHSTEMCTINQKT